MFINLKNIFIGLLVLVFSVVSFGAFAQINTGESDGSADNGDDSLTDSYSMYKEFEFGDSMNWDDCFNLSIMPGALVCPGTPPTPTITAKFSYYDIVAMVEVVPDPWQSYLPSESLFDFTDEADDSLRGRVGGATGVMGSGYSGQGKSAAKEHIGQHKYETHVWAISDFWRMKTSSPVDGCVSLACKNEDYTGCVQAVADSVINVGGGMSDTISSTNTADGTDTQGKGVTNGETGEVSYENGEVYEKDNSGDSGSSGGYVKTREAGNYGVEGLGKSADTANSAYDMIVTGGQAVALAKEAAKFADNPGGYVKGAAIGYATGQIVNYASEYVASEFGEGEDGSSDSSDPNSKNDQYYSSAAAIDENSYEVNYAGGTNEYKPLPESTKSDASAPEEPAALGSDSETQGDASQTGNDVSNNAFGTDSEGNQEAATDVGNFMDSATETMGTVFSIIDRITYFNITELVIQMVATMLPIQIYPVYLSERHAKASATGGFFWGPVFQQFAEAGAGLIMPIFCMSQILSMSAEGVLGFMFDSDFDVLGSLGPLGAFIQNRCVGSWGPLEPRLTLIGSGDPFVAAGIASVRGLNIAQNITGSDFNQSINNTPYHELKFNLDWPHQSSCYGFKGFEGLSRGWTTPVGGILDNVSGAVQSGDTSALADAAADSTVGQARKQGGYVFTYWRHRKCEYLYSCDVWIGDTGL